MVGGGGDQGEAPDLKLGRGVPLTLQKCVHFCTQTMKKSIPIIIPMYSFFSTHVYPQTKIKMIRMRKAIKCVGVTTVAFTYLTIGNAPTVTVYPRYWVIDILLWPFGGEFYMQR